MTYPRVAGAGTRPGRTDAQRRKRATYDRQMASGSLDDAQRRPLLAGSVDDQLLAGPSSVSSQGRTRRESMNSVQSDYTQRTRRESHASVGRDSSQSTVSAWMSEHDGAAHPEFDTARILARDWAASEVHVRTALLARASSKARLTAPDRIPSTPHDNKMARVRRRIVTIMESNCMQMIMITLILVEMLAVLFELLLEIGFLSFSDKIDQPLINTLHYTSVSILSLFMMEFGVYFFALGFKFCCRAWLLLDVVIVTVALITELYMHHRSASERTGEPADDESEIITKEIIFVVTLRIIRIVHSLFTQFQRHEDRITVSNLCSFVARLLIPAAYLVNVFTSYEYE